MKFGENLKLIRKQKNISQEFLAEKLGVARQSISKWETGENYPSMQNIICLCDIFKCKMNDIVRVDFTDLDFLDEEIKMKVVKLNQEEQKKVKILSKVLFMIGRIGSILCKVAIGFVAVAMICVPLILSCIDVQDNELKVNGEVIKITELNEGIRISTNDDQVIISDLKNEDVNTLKNALTKYDKPLLITLIELGFIILIVFIVFIMKVLNHLNKLFTNIYDGDTPFTLENVSHIKSMSYYMIASIIAGTDFAKILTAIEAAIMPIPNLATVSANCVKAAFAPTLFKRTATAAMVAIPVANDNNPVRIMDPTL